MSASEWCGEPHPQAECDEALWRPLDALPENIIPFVRRAIKHYSQSGDSFADVLRQRKCALRRIADVAAGIEAGADGRGVEVC